MTVNGSKNSDNDFPEIAQTLITYGAKINLRNKTGLTPLNLAVLGGKTHTLPILLKAKADPDIQNNYGWTPLITASSKGDLNIVNALLKAKADPNIQANDGWTALHMTVNKNNDYSSIADTLIKNGIKMDAENNNEMTALYLSIVNNSKKTNKVLKLAGAKYMGMFYVKMRRKVADKVCNIDNELSDELKALRKKICR
jgi:uncharacterized protein